MWCPRLACPAAGRAAHVPPVARRREQRLRASGSGHFKPLVQLGCRSSSKCTPSSSSGSTRVAVAAGEGRKMAAAAAGDLRSEYFQVLLSRRRDLQGDGVAPEEGVDKLKEKMVD